MSSIPHGLRAVPSATVARLRPRCGYDFRRRRRCEYTVNVDVPLDSLLVWIAVRCPSFVLCSVVLHWKRRRATVESSARRFAAVDLGRSGSDDKIWTTVRRTMRASKEDTTRAGT